MWLFKVILGQIWCVEDENLLATWSFSVKFLLNVFVWLGLGGYSGVVVANDCICDSEIFIVFCRILILIIMSLSSPFRFNALLFTFILRFVRTMVVSSPFKLVCYTSDLSLYGVLIPLYMNLNGFSGDLYVTIGSLSIDLEFPSIIEELSKGTLCVLDGGMLRYYPIFGSQTSVFPFVCHQNVLMAPV